MTPKRRSWVPLIVGVVLWAGGPAVAAGQQTAKVKPQGRIAPCTPAPTSTANRKTQESCEPADPANPANEDETDQDAPRAPAAQGASDRHPEESPAEPIEADAITAVEPTAPDPEDGPVGAAASGLAGQGAREGRTGGTPRDITVGRDVGSARPTPEAFRDSLANRPEGAAENTRQTEADGTARRRTPGRGAEDFIRDRTANRPDPATITNRGPSPASTTGSGSGAQPVPTPFPNTGGSGTVDTGGGSSTSGGGTSAGDEAGVVKSVEVVPVVNEPDAAPEPAPPADDGVTPEDSVALTSPDQGDADSRAKAVDLVCRTTGNCPQDRKADDGTVDPTPDGKVTTGLAARGAPPKGRTGGPVDPAPDSGDSASAPGGLGPRDRVDDFEGQDGGGGTPPDAQ